MPLSRRYTPEWSPGDTGLIGMDFSYILPPGVGILPMGADQPRGPSNAYSQPVPRLEIWYNTADPVPAPDWDVDPSLSAYPPGWFFTSVDGQPQWVRTTTGEGLIGTAVMGAGPGSAYLALGTAVEGRAVYARLQGGVAGQDYQLRWVIGDTAGNIWTRTALLLCAPTS